MKRNTFLLLVLILSACSSDDSPVIENNGPLKTVLTYNETSSPLSNDYFYVDGKLDRIIVTNPLTGFYDATTFVFEENKILSVSGLIYTYDGEKIISGVGMLTSSETYDVVYEYPNSQTVIKKEYISNVLTSHQEYDYDINNDVVERRSYNLEDNSISIYHTQHNDTVSPVVSLYPSAYRKIKGMSDHLETSLTSLTSNSITEYSYYQNGLVKKAIIRTIKETRYEEYFYY